MYKYKVLHYRLYVCRQYLHFVLQNIKKDHNAIIDKNSININFLIDKKILFNFT